MVRQPLPGDVGGAAGNDIDPPAGLGVDEHGRVDLAAAQREVIDPEHPRHRHLGQGDLERTRSAVCRETKMPSAGSSRTDARPANSRATVLTWAASREMRRW